MTTLFLSLKFMLYFFLHALKNKEHNSCISPEQGIQMIIH